MRCLHKVIAVDSPFGGKAVLVQTLETSRLVEMYKQKCGVDVAAQFNGARSVELFECVDTGYRFWRPSSVAGDEAFYRLLSVAWKNYYRAERWEYGIARRLASSADHLLEIGCGDGYFLRSLEGQMLDAVGLELNDETRGRAVTTFPILHSTVEEMAAQRHGSFDVVCSFQVLEHIPDPASFIQSALRCLSADGQLVISVPNNEYLPHARQEDAFDLPPHHMGHFTPRVMHNLGNFFGIRLVHLTTEPTRRYHPLDKQGRFPARLAHLFVQSARGLVDRIAGMPGPNLIAAYRK